MRGKYLVVARRASTTVNLRWVPSVENLPPVVFLALRNGPTRYHEEVLLHWTARCRSRFCIVERRESSQPEAITIFAGVDEGFDHFGIYKIAPELI